MKIIGAQGMTDTVLQQVYGKVTLAIRTQYHQLQFVLKVVAICTDNCMSLVQTLVLCCCLTGTVNPHSAFKL